MTKPQGSSVHRRKVLLAGAEPSVQGLIATFLHSMGWTCTVVQSKEEASAILQKEVFDAVVIDLGRSEAEAERAILRIKQMRPSLGDRILAISSVDADPRISELMERHDLIPLSHDGLLPQLWGSLQELVVWSRSRELAPRAMQVARLIFDSLRYPQPEGVRSQSSRARQLAYQYNRTIIDVSIEFADRTGRMSLAGQVLESEKKGRNDCLPVLLVSGVGTLVRTATNQCGEFRMECEFPGDASLEIRLGERSWVVVPLGKMDWAARTSRWPVETSS